MIIRSALLSILSISTAMAAPALAYTKAEKADSNSSSRNGKSVVGSATVTIINSGWRSTDTTNRKGRDTRARACDLSADGSAVPCQLLITDLH